MFQESDFDPDAIGPRSLIFWGTPGPRTGVSVVVGDRVEDLLAWLRDRAVVEGPGSALSRSYAAIQSATQTAGSDPEVRADALGAALQDAGIAVYALGPLDRELDDVDSLRSRIWTDTPPDDVVPEAVWRGGEAHVESSGSSVTPPLADAEPDKAYRLEEEVEDWAEHESADFESVEFREFLATRLDALRTARPERRAA